MNLFRRTSRSRRRVYSELDPEDIFLDSHNRPGFDKSKLEGTLEKPIKQNISVVVAIIIISVFSVFIVRMYRMQVISGDVYIARAEKNMMRTTPIFPLRGTIEDRNGVLLAWNESDDAGEIKKRVYTTLPGFSNVVGYVSYPKKDQSGVFWQEEYLGKDGVEKQFQDSLLGEKGEKIIEVSATHEIISQNTTIPPTPGQNIKLSLDAKVQTRMYEEIEKLANQAHFIAGSGVMIDIKTGELISLVSYPEYNNNLMTNASTNDEKAQVASDLLSKKNKFLNRAISGLFIPGSTVKPFVALAALEEKIISPQQNILSTGQITIKNKYGGPDTIFKDWKVHGYVDMRKAIAVSSDEYFYQIGGGYLSQPGLGIKRIFSYMDSFGFEDYTGINLPGEVKGVVPSEEWKKKKFNGADWLLGNTYHTSIGQYGFLTTPIELARSYTMIANGGDLVTPSILFGGSTTTKRVSFSQDNLRVVQEGMRKSVLEGTAHYVNIPGFTAAGKTGTAEVGAHKEQVNSLVAVYFPYEKPRYVLVIVMERAPKGNTYGATLAAQQVVTFLRDETDYTK